MTGTSETASGLTNEIRMGATMAAVAAAAAAAGETQMVIDMTTAAVAAEEIKIVETDASMRRTAAKRAMITCRPAREPRRR